MGCNCKKKPEPTPISEPVLDEIRRTDYPDTPDGQLAYELELYNQRKHDEIDHFNNIDDYPLIHD